MKTPNALFYKIEIIEPDDKESVFLKQIEDLRLRAQDIVSGENNSVNLREIYESLKKLNDKVWAYSYSRLKGRPMEYWPLYSYDWEGGVYRFKKILPTEYKEAIAAGKRNAFCLGPDDVKVINNYNNSLYHLNYLGQSLDEM